MPASRAALAAVAALLGLLAAAPAHAATPPRVLAEDFGASLRAWRTTGELRLARTNDLPGPALRLTRPSSARGPGTFRRSLPGSAQALSIDVKIPSRTVFELVLGNGAIRFERPSGDSLEVVVGDTRTEAAQRPGWRGRDWHHVTVTGSSRPVVAIDGVVVEGGPRVARTIGLRVERGSASVAALVASPQQDARGLILHRLAEIAAQTRPGRFFVGTGTSDGLLRFSNDWTSGFWPGSLWAASDLTRASQLFRRWATDATVRHLGRERYESHDLGFMYEHSSVEAYRHLCPPARRRESSCRRLRASGLEAAKTLLSLAASNAAAGMLPTRSAAAPCRDCGPDEADTIVDSMMNLHLMLWATSETRDRRYRDAAVRSADGVARHLVRADGSTAQSVHVRRSDGSVLRVHTHQGLRDDSTWSRGQGWGLYGFAQLGARLKRADYLAIAERLAAYVERRLPAAGVPPYDYDAPGGAPIDTSAGVITAAGLYRLADACATASADCAGSRRWRLLADRMLAASLKKVERRPPIGFVGSQVYSLGGSATWDDGGEYAFGVHYALEAVSASLDS